MQLRLTWNQPCDQPGQNSEVSLSPGFKGMHHLVWLKEFSVSYFLKKWQNRIRDQELPKNTGTGPSQQSHDHRSQALSLCRHISQLPFTKQDKITKRDSQHLFILDNTVQNTLYRIMYTDGTPVPPQKTVQNFNAK